MKQIGRILVIGMGSTGFICCNKDDLIFAQAENIAQKSPVIPPIWRELTAVSTTPKSVFQFKIDKLEPLIYHSNMGGSGKKRYNRKGKQTKYF